MESKLSKHPPSPGESRERMQRVRVGLTGLAAVGLIVVVSTAIATSVRRQVSETTAVASPPPVVATTTASNASDQKTEPLAQLGVAPDAKDRAPQPVRPR